MIDKNRVRTMEARTDNNDKFKFSRARPNDAVSIKQMRIRFFLKAEVNGKLNGFVCQPLKMKAKYLGIFFSTTTSTTSK